MMTSDYMFFTEPKYCLTVPEGYYQRVHDMHENGGFGSIGYANFDTADYELCYRIDLNFTYAAATAVAPLRVRRP